MSADHTDMTGRTWPRGTAYRPVDRGNATVDRNGELVTVTRQRIVIESRHYQAVLADGFGQTVDFEV